jgi:Uma2 family endonuclease
MTWAEICADKRLQDLPFRIESDRWGNIIMSPPPRSRHGQYQAEIVRLLWAFLRGGIVVSECPIETSDGVKAVDAAWVSNERNDSHPNDPAYLIAPEICVEILSPSNSDSEMEFRRRLYFEKGAVEFWLCDLNGDMTFFDAAGSLPQSKLCPQFPMQVEVGA